MAKRTTKSAKAETATKASPVKTERKYERSFAEEKRLRTERIQEEFGDLVMHECSVTKGKTLPVGTKVHVLWVGAAGRFMNPTAKISHKGEEGWINVNFLKKGKALDAETRSLYEAEEEERKSATILMEGFALKQNAAGTSVLVQCPLRFVPDWIPTVFIEKVGTVGDRTIFEVTKWKLAKLWGSEADIEKLEKQQAALEKARD